MRIVILAAFFACAMAGESAAPSWPRLPLDLVLSGLPSKLQQQNDEKIVGGSPVVPNSLPFQISLQRRSLTGTYSQSCGGSILNENVIINAAHCVVNTNVTTFLVVAGEHSLKTKSGLEQERKVVKTTAHENYNPRTYENDISLIFLDAPLDLSVPSAKAIALPAKNLTIADGKGLTVSGWGTTRAGGTISDVLLSVVVPAVSDADCDTAYAPSNNNVLPSMICAGIIGTGGVDSCQGDSGGPLFMGDGSAADPFTQVGIVSWGVGCAEPDYPGVYTEVSYFVDWIAQNQ